MRQRYRSEIRNWDKDASDALEDPEYVPGESNRNVIWNADD
jgi:hypothetical protein